MTKTKTMTITRAEVEAKMKAATQAIAAFEKQERARSIALKNRDWAHMLAQKFFGVTGTTRVLSRSVKQIGASWNDTFRVGGEGRTWEGAVADFKAKRRARTKFVNSGLPLAAQRGLPELGTPEAAIGWPNQPDEPYQAETPGFRD